MDVKSELEICCKFEDDPVNPKEKKTPHLKILIHYIVFNDTIIWHFILLFYNTFFLKWKFISYKEFTMYLFTHVH